MEAGVETGRLKMLIAVLVVVLFVVVGDEALLIGCPFPGSYLVGLVVTPCVAHNRGASQ